MTSDSEYQPDYSGQYALAGPARGYDPRITPIRGDLADIALAGKLFAPHYVVPMARAIAAPFAAVRKDASHDAEAVSELLAGEHFMLLDVAGGWGWGWCAHDRVNGYLPMDVLGEPAGHTPAISAGDAVAAALAQLGTAFAPGGRGGAGFDCSGLAQTSFAAAGVALPRFADQQAASGIAADGAAQRGDLVVFDGHVAVALDAAEIIHACADQGKVVSELLADAIASRGEPTAIRRPL